MINHHMIEMDYNLHQERLNARLEWLRRNGQIYPGQMRERSVRYRISQLLMQTGGRLQALGHRLDTPRLARTGA